MGKSLIIKGADFSDVAVPAMIVKSKYIVIGAQNVRAALRQGESSRSTLIVYSKLLDNQLWGADGPSYTPPSDMNHYELNTIPPNATKVKVTAGINLSICLFTVDYKGCFYPAWSDNGGVQEILLSSYPNAVFFSVNFQSGTVNIENVTIEFE